MDVFAVCHDINDLICKGDESAARNVLIQLLDYHAKNELPYTDVVNHLIRETGLYPYMQTASSEWSDRFVCEAFKVPIGKKETSTLHRDQSLLLARLLDGKDIAVSAPTSFGKSFVIDAFIAIKKPTNVVIIVPTIALTDETRRRLYRKFASDYKIITTTDVQLSDKNIFIFPQERAIHYADSIESIDILIVDEFYKSSAVFESERSPSLIRAIMKLGRKSRQKYFLAPNISSLGENPFTKDMEFLKLDLHTVYLEKHNLYEEINKNEAAKSEALLKILAEKQTKSLIYAGTYSNITKVANLLIDRHPVLDEPLLHDFSKWLSDHYSVNWNLTSLVNRGTGVHNGSLHRSLSQLQIKLFSEPNGLRNLISTSSIIEGVNTSAENVVIWMNKTGRAKLNDFTYKNIIGRGGRMFKHFIGKIYILEPPPQDSAVQLDIPFPDEILGDLDEAEYKTQLTDDQINYIASYRTEMQNLIGKDGYDTLSKNNVFQNNADLIRDIAREMKSSPSEWNGLSYLNSDQPDDWDRLLFKILKIRPNIWDTKHATFVKFVKILSSNWTRGIPDLLDELEEYDVGLDAFFLLERNVAFKLASLVNDVNVLQKHLLQKNNYDLAPFVSHLSHAFLPSVVYQLEEFGLPRMLSRQIHAVGILDLEDMSLTLHDAIQRLRTIGADTVADKARLVGFDRYIVDYFYEGIQIDG